jgi:tripartite-type tricarboxylate transporter receptor subunit TctC
VPYRGAGPALNDLLGGQIPLIWASPVAVMPFVEQGRAKALGVSTPHRLPAMPNIPTVSESGVPDFDVTPWYGVATQAKVPPEIVVRIGQTVGEITKLPDVQRRMSTLGLDIEFRNGTEFRELIARDDGRYGAVIRKAGIQAN